MPVVAYKWLGPPPWKLTTKAPLDFLILERPSAAFNDAMTSQLVRLGTNHKVDPDQDCFAPWAKPKRLGTWLLGYQHNHELLSSTTSTVASSSTLLP